MCRCRFVVSNWLASQELIPAASHTLAHATASAKQGPEKPNKHSTSNDWRREARGAMISSKVWERVWVRGCASVSVCVCACMVELWLFVVVHACMSVRMGARVMLIDMLVACRLLDAGCSPLGFQRWVLEKGWLPA